MTLIVSFTSKLQNITCSINGPRNTLRYKVGSEVTVNTQIWDLYERNFIVRRQLCNFHCHFPHKVIKSIDLYAATNSKGGHSNRNQSLKGHKQTIAYFRNFGVFLVDIAMISEIDCQDCIPAVVGKLFESKNFVSTFLRDSIYQLVHIFTRLLISHYI